MWLKVLFWRFSTGVFYSAQLDGLTRWFLNVSAEALLAVPVPSELQPAESVRVLSVCLSAHPRTAEDTEAVWSKMRLRTVLVTVLLTVAVAYYVYIPLPDDTQEPWKLMLMDAVTRTVFNLVRE